MNTHFTIINHPLTQQIGWAVLHSLWQGALIGVAFRLSLFALRRRSANARYLAGCLSLALLLAAPVATVLVQAWPSPATGQGAFVAAGPPEGGLATFKALGLGGANAAPGPGWLSQWGADFLGRLAPLLAMVWVLGVSFSTVRLTQGCWRVRSVRTKDNEPVDAAWMETLNDLRCRLGVSRPVRLLKSALVEVPTVIGWFRPVILLPAASLIGLTPGQLEAILAHELAHVRRLDYVVNAFQCLVETLMFYHPVAWWISRCIREERENCCDDMVILVCGDRLAYARALATLEGFRAGLPEWAFAASGGSLLNRIRRLLGESNEHGSATVRQVSGLALVGIGLVLIVLGVRLLVSPTTYQSAVRIRIERDPSGIPGLADPRNQTAYDPYFIQTEFELLQSEAVLGRVVESLDLNNEWGKKYAGGTRLKTSETVALLKSRMELRPVGSTSLVEIRVFSDKSDEAAKIANAIAESYKTLRYEQLAQMQRGGIKALEARFQEQEAKVREAQKRVDALRGELNISDAAASADSPPPLMTADTLRKLESLRIEHKAEYVRQATLLDRLRKLEKDSGPDTLAQAITTAVPDPVLNGFFEQHGVAGQKLVSVAKEYGPQHAEVLKAKAVVEDLRQKITNRVAGIMVGLEVRVASLKKGLESLEEEVGKATTNDMATAAQSRPYFDAKRNLDELQRFRQILDSKMASEKIEVQLPKTAIVEITDPAVPALRPISPNLPRALALIALGILLGLVGLLLLTGWPHRDKMPASRES